MRTIRSIMGKMLSHWTHCNCHLGKKEKISKQVKFHNGNSVVPLRRWGTHIQLRRKVLTKRARKWVVEVCLVQTSFVWLPQTLTFIVKTDSKLFHSPQTMCRTEFAKQIISVNIILKLLFKQIWQVLCLATLG